MLKLYLEFLELVMSHQNVGLRRKWIRNVDQEQLCLWACLMKVPNGPGELFFCYAFKIIEASTVFQINK